MYVDHLQRCDLYLLVSICLSHHGADQLLNVILAFTLRRGAYFHSDLKDDSLNVRVHVAAELFEPSHLLDQLFVLKLLDWHCDYFHFLPLSTK